MAARGRRASTVIVRFKVCCIASVAEAHLAIAHGASAIGLVAKMPSGPGVIPEDRIAAIAGRIPPGVGSFLLTSETDAEEIANLQINCRVNTVQLCDRMPPGEHAALRALLPGVGLVQVVHVTGPEAVDEARSAARHVDALLLDSGNPSLAVKELGGTGRTHDWAISRTIVEKCPVPVFLAGGLTPENVAEAIRVVEPYAVDVCTGLRTDGRLEENKLAAFAEAVRAARPPGKARG
jgi:phosphoribosylanthranilate isomerase